MGRCARLEGLLIVAVLGLLAAVVAPPARAAAAGAIVNAECLAVLNCEAPRSDWKIVGSNAPGYIFYPGERVDLTLQLKKVQAAFALEVVEISTRDPERLVKSMDGFTDTGGHAPLLSLEGKPSVHPFKVDFGEDKSATTTVEGVPVPDRFGTYAVILVVKDAAGGQTLRCFMGTLVRVPAARDYGTIENTPVFGEGQFMEFRFIEERARIYSRMGIRGWRSELSWSEDAQGVYHWDSYDRLFGAAKAAGCRIMVTLGGHPPQFLPFGTPTPAASWTPKSGGYWGTAHWMCSPDLLPRYGKWIEAFCDRYYDKGNGALWGIENYNEPWEGGGISGWAADCLYYRALQRTIGEAARKTSPHIRLLAASSIMNTEDKLYSDGSREFDRWLDIFTDHYVVPPMCYGPMVAAAHGKQSMETETWFVNAEYQLPQAMCQFMASGQARVAPWHPRVLFEGGFPSPVVTATAAFNWFATGKSFEKLVFKNHLPWVFQFGKDDDPHALLVLFGRLVSQGGNEPKRRLWAQVDDAPGGTITIDNSDGLLQFHDLSGNPAFIGQKTVVLKMNIQPTYILCPKGAKAAADRLAKARIDGKRPVEIIPHDFDRPPAAGAALRVSVHNCLNRAIEGTLAVRAPEEITLKQSSLPSAIAPGETKTFVFEITSARQSAENAYPFSFLFASDAGKAQYAETLNACVIPRGTKTVDGDLSDWASVPGVKSMAGKAAQEASELLRRPWLRIREANPEGSLAEFKLAWDPDFLYIAARVYDPTFEEPAPSFAERDENSYFHTAADDGVSPYKEFIEQARTKDPKATFGDHTYVYRNSPEAWIPFRRDRLQIALDVTEGWHDMIGDAERVPWGFHAVPDTDYEYEIYQTAGGGELWRALAPGVPRIHDFPRQPRGTPTTGLVAGAKCVVKRDPDSKTYTYEAAIPRSELKDLKLQAGTQVGIMLRAGDGKGAHCDFGADKAATKLNGLTLHPYWEVSPNCGVRWTLVE